MWVFLFITPTPIISLESPLFLYAILVNFWNQNHDLGEQPNSTSLQPNSKSYWSRNVLLHFGLVDNRDLILTTIFSQVRRKRCEIGFFLVIYLNTLRSKEQNRLFFFTYLINLNYFVRIRITKKSRPFYLKFQMKSWNINFLRSDYSQILNHDEKKREK